MSSLHRIKVSTFSLASFLLFFLSAFCSFFHSSSLDTSEPPADAACHDTVISAIKTERGLALQDLITGAYEYIETIEFKPHVRIYLLDYLATTEYVLLQSQFMVGFIFTCHAYHHLDIGCPLVQARRSS